MHATMNYACMDYQCSCWTGLKNWPSYFKASFHFISSSFCVSTIRYNDRKRIMRSTDDEFKKDPQNVFVLLGHTVDGSRCEYREQHEREKFN